MIEVKQAVQLAKEKAVEMLGQGPFNLEEIEQDSYKNREVWSITLSLPRSPDSMSKLSMLSYFDPLQYKRFLIDAETGDLLAMRLREVAKQ
jgi:hypothetical protein